MAAFVNSKGNKANFEHFKFTTNTILNRPCPFIYKALGIRQHRTFVSKLHVRHPNPQKLTTMPDANADALEQTIQQALQAAVLPLTQRLVQLTEKVDDTCQLLTPFDDRLNDIMDRLNHILQFLQIKYAFYGSMLPTTESTKLCKPPQHYANHAQPQYNNADPQPQYRPNRDICGRSNHSTLQCSSPCQNCGRTGHQTATCRSQCSTEIRIVHLRLQIKIIIGEIKAKNYCVGVATAHDTDALENNAIQSF
uniref:CCHC-type domain-containing protein n=1 Tax=Romanomermis culicivorax TaxID=13658 RepID=A0A915I3V1_ROMCU